MEGGGKEEGEVCFKSSIPSKFVNTSGTIEWVFFCTEKVFLLRRSFY